MNRIEIAISKKEIEIRERIADGRTTKELVEETQELLDLDLNEFVKFQELKTLASSIGDISLSEAQTIYVLLGEDPTVFNEQPVHVKAVLTGIFGELLLRRIEGKM